MTYIILGALSFVFLYIFDLHKLSPISRLCNLCFAAGCLGLAGATFLLLFQGISRPWFWQGSIPFLLLSFLSFLFMLYALFFALPFNRTYLQGDGNQVVDTGLYALCRHPGVLGFFAMYLFLWLATGSSLVLAAALIWTGMDILHIWVQDRYFFPKALKGYEAYRRTTPFLIPTKKSMADCLEDFRKGRSLA